MTRSWRWWRDDGRSTCIVLADATAHVEADISRSSSSPTYMNERDKGQA